MIARFAAFVLAIWLLGFGWFAATLPQAASNKERTDVIVVPTGGVGRIDRGVALLHEGSAQKMLVSGVFEGVKPDEFAAEYKLSPEEMECCVVLGFSALDTRGNARETAQWVRNGGYRSLRLVTSDWHMRRSANEIEQVLPPGVRVLEDAVPSEPSLKILFLEYLKLLASWLGNL
ncbi:YdcF family protein [Altererythrobacter salegens]|uniref:YdcF family protein n=1 Tax=Croceibacterium salegens TaxID=1737568 RepID=A0A6I4SYX7_9SPHN|nr:YdcF family protein [Croceibacterium salegens]